MEFKSVIKEQPEGIFHTVELERVIKEQPERILHTVELESVIKEQPEGILQWSLKVLSKNSQEEYYIQRS